MTDHEAQQTMGTRPANGALAGRYFRAPVFAVAPMIDWIDFSKK